MKLLPNDNPNARNMLREMELQRSARTERRSGLMVELETIDAELEAIQKVIDGLRYLAGDQPEQPRVAETGTTPARVIGPKTFDGISVRWSALYLLAELKPGPLQTPVIAEALQSGGYTTEGKNFTANVSAVLSVMTNQRKETELVDGGYQITALGRMAWGAIQNTPQWAKHVASSGSVLPFSQ